MIADIGRVLAAIALVLILIGVLAYLIAHGWNVTLA